MFDRFKRKSIEIICPACKGGQTEPALAFSTYCRNCGEHLKIMKGVARLHSGVQVSGVSPIKVVSHLPEEGGPKPAPTSEVAPRKGKKRQKGKRKRARERKAKAKGKKTPKETPEEVVAEEPIEQPIDAKPTSVAEAFGLTPVEDGASEDSAEAHNDESENSETSIFAKMAAPEPEEIDELTEGSMGAMISELVDQEKKRVKAMAGRPNTQDEATTPKKTSSLAKSVKPRLQSNQIRVRCFRCNHEQKESRHAESTQCGRCNTYISLMDYQIRQPSDRVIRTRGNVVVHRKGNLIGQDLACRNLVAMGTVSSRIDCSGEARFKHSGSVKGHVYCENLVVEKGTIVEFVDGVHTEGAQILGTLRGDITCAGVVQVRRTGIIDGDVTAQELDMPDGGTLTGELVLDPDLKADLPVIKGYDPSIID